MDYSKFHEGAKFIGLARLRGFIDEPNERNNTRRKCLAIDIVATGIGAIKVYNKYDISYLLYRTTRQIFIAPRGARVSRVGNRTSYLASACHFALRPARWKVPLEGIAESRRVSSRRAWSPMDLANGRTKNSVSNARFRVRLSLRLRQS